MKIKKLIFIVMCILISPVAAAPLFAFAIGTGKALTVKEFIIGYLSIAALFSVLAGFSCLMSWASSFIGKEEV